MTANVAVGDPPPPKNAASGPPAAGSYVDLGCILGNPYGTQRTATVTVSISPGNGVTVEPKPWPIL
ncbi:hypothetical protein [Cellulosimicrobium cellulans]|uniref:hypothetical protein n=1 Tax=Cellulosimicrobium cellulans TaxID=1710 RepID=UPI0020CD109C|nr:hypothetical protein NMQ07_14670 [Cellulosimicrobium cellulans]